MENENRTAERILSGKDSYFMAIKERYGEDVSDRVRTEAARLLDEYLSLHDPLPHSEAIHVEDNIIPTAYIYGALKGIVGEEALELMKKIKQEKGFSMIILMLTDVLLEGTQIIYVGDDNAIEQAFNVVPKDNTAFLPRVMSRKKQVIPMLSALWG